MALSDVAICNSALAKVGAAPINTLDDESRNGRICKEQYAKVRRKMLSSHPWNFAIARVALSATTNVPAFEYSKEFLLPSDVLRVIETDLYESDPWKVEFNVDNNKVLLCNSSAVKIKYIKDITDPTKFPPYFDEVLAWGLASDICYAITQSFSVTQQMYSASKNELREARSMDAQESGRDTFEANAWIDVRF